MGNELDATKISHDQNVVNAYVNDPLVHDRVSTRFFTELVAAMNTAHRQATSLQIPILMQVAGDDHLVNARSSKKFFQKLAARDKTLYVYDGLYHEIFNELGGQRKQVLKDLEGWLEKRIFIP
jgi:alpha-beta hydrolase superfamily lysophospholipase